MDITNHVCELNEDGYTIIRNGFSTELADKIVNEFEEWASIPENKFVTCQRKRVTNFHIYSKNTLELVTNDKVHNIISKFLNGEHVVYTSLFFREGTSQEYHRDTPHFYTNPIDKYCGVWYALEDINPESGPLKYFKKSHLIDDPNGHIIYNKNKDVNNSYPKNNLNSIIEYNQIIEKMCIDNNLTEFNHTNFEVIKKGDIIIWHPRLLHGGSDVINPTLTRYSMVTHNVTYNVPVFSSAHFFIDEPTKEYMENKCLFNYLTFNGVKYVDHNIGPQVQLSYL